MASPFFLDSRFFLGFLNVAYTGKQSSFFFTPFHIIVYGFLFFLFLVSFLSSFFFLSFFFFFLSFFFFLFIFFSLGWPSLRAISGGLSAVAATVLGIISGWRSAVGYDFRWNPCLAARCAVLLPPTLSSSLLLLLIPSFLLPFFLSFFLASRHSSRFFVTIPGGSYRVYQS